MHTDSSDSLSTVLAMRLVDRTIWSPGVPNNYQCIKHQSLSDIRRDFVRWTITKPEKTPGRDSERAPTDLCLADRSFWVAGDETPNHSSHLILVTMEVLLCTRHWYKRTRLSTSFRILKISILCNAQLLIVRHPQFEQLQVSPRSAVRVLTLPHWRPT